MPWTIVRRRLGRAGGPKQRLARQRQWDRTYGEGCWETGYVIDGEFISQEEAFDRIYVASYAAHFDAHPEDLAELVRTAKILRNPHAEATGGVDLQVPAVLRCLGDRGLQLEGRAVVDIGTWKGEYSHALSVRLSPLHVKVVGDPRLSLESFWQRKKCLAVWGP